MINGVRVMVEGIQKYGEMLYQYSDPTWYQVEVFATWFIHAYNKNKPDGFKGLTWKVDE